MNDTKIRAAIENLLGEDDGLTFHQVTLELARELDDVDVDDISRILDDMIDDGDVTEDEDGLVFLTAA